MFINAKAFAKGNQRQETLIKSFIERGATETDVCCLINPDNPEDQVMIQELEHLKLASRKDDSKKWRLTPDAEFSRNLASSITIPGGLKISELRVGNQCFSEAENLNAFSEMKAYVRCPDVPKVDLILTYPCSDCDTRPIQCPFCLSKVPIMSNGQMATKSAILSCEHLLFIVEASGKFAFKAIELQNYLAQGSAEEFPWGDRFLPRDLLEVAAMSSPIRQLGMLNWPGSVAFQIFPESKEASFADFIPTAIVGFAPNERRIPKN